MCAVSLHMSLPRTTLRDLRGQLAGAGHAATGAMMPRYLSTLGLVIVVVVASAGCAAPDADDDVSSADQANSVDESVAKTTVMKQQLSGSRLEIRASLQVTKDVAMLGMSTSTWCMLRLSPSPDRLLPSIPKGDVYGVDTGAIRLERVNGFLGWSIPLTNEVVASGAPGSPSDMVLECGGLTAPNTAPTARAIRESIGMVNGRMPPTVTVRMTAPGAS